MAHVRVKGVHINTEHFSDHKGIKALKSDDRKLFDHLPKDEQEEAYAELWQHMHPDEKPKPATPPKAETAAE